jgi:hypothetical protein
MNQDSYAILPDVLSPIVLRMGEVHPDTLPPMLLVCNTSTLRQMLVTWLVATWYKCSNVHQHRGGETDDECFQACSNHFVVHMTDCAKSESLLKRMEGILANESIVRMSKHNMIVLLPERTDNKTSQRIKVLIDKHLNNCSIVMLCTVLHGVQACIQDRCTTIRCIAERTHWVSAMEKQGIDRSIAEAVMADPRAADPLSAMQLAAVMTHTHQLPPSHLDRFINGVLDKLSTEGITVSQVLSVSRHAARTAVNFRIPLHMFAASASRILGSTGNDALAACVVRLAADLSDGGIDATNRHELIMYETMLMELVKCIHCDSCQHRCETV